MEGTKEPESSGVLPALKNQKNGGSELVLWETLGNYFFWICMPWCNQPSAGHVRSSLWPYGGTTGHPFLKPPPWSSSSRAPLQHPQVAAIGNTKKKTSGTPLWGILPPFMILMGGYGWFPQQKKSIDDHRDRCQELRRPNGRGGTAGAFGTDWKIPSNK